MSTFRGSDFLGMNGRMPIAALPIKPATARSTRLVRIGLGGRIKVLLHRIRPYYDEKAVNVGHLHKWH